ncbi:hypothetical protein [Empedobacter brevis]|uniref:hypothetical protein n=1 Tax=Empedobacter brevis TaxID=247 RepID=UPI00333FF388
MMTIGYFILYLNRTKSTYLFFLVVFFTTSAWASSTDFLESNKDSLPSSKHSIVTIKEHTIFYISENTTTKNLNIKENKATDIRGHHEKEDIKKNVSKKFKNKVEAKKIKHLHQPKLIQKQKNLTYLPYTPQSYFNLYKPAISGIFHEVFSTHAAVFFSTVKNLMLHTIHYKKTYYHYIFCDYAICLSHLEIRSPSMFI